MQKHRIVEVEHVEDQIVTFPSPPKPLALRLAAVGDISAASPARRLQAELAHAFAADAGWSVKRTVIVGLVFHAVILGALGVAAGNLLP
jgi:hypothetical protein